MGTMNFSIPDELKEKFNAVFKDANKSAIIARMMERAIEDEERRARKGSLVDRIAEFHAESSMRKFAKSAKTFASETGC